MMTMNEQAASVLTPPNPGRKAVNEILRHVDALIRSKDLAKAFLEIQKAKTLDEKNPYVRAYEERLSDLIEAKKKSDLLQEKQQTEELEQREKEQRYRNAQSAQQKYADKQVSAQAEIRIPVATRVEEIVQRPQSVSSAPTPAHPVHGMVIGRNDKSDRQQRQKVMIIDDDAEFLSVLTQVINMNGYECSAFETTDEAYQSLRTGMHPDIIVCDINLESSTMGGFSYYEKVRSEERFSSVPFIFLSGLADEAVIRTGKELGADDYLTKPVTEDMLLSTIKGKLKRYRQLQKQAM